MREATKRQTAGRLAPLALALGLAGAGAAPACAQEPASEGANAPDSAAVARMLAGGERWATDFSRIAVDPREIVSGGPPKDGIPALDEPRFVSAAEADRWLEDREPVLVVEGEDETKAYPLRILTWHEIVNDAVDGRPVAVTFCPLCNTALVFDRTPDGRILEFGVTGRLRHSDLIMYDRQTESWWQQASGEAIVGTYAGAELEFVPANTFSWRRVKQLYPEAIVLSRETGHRRDYGANPYVGYDRPGGAPLPGFVRGETDDRLQPLERVVAVEGGAGWAAPFSALRELRVVNATAGERRIVVFWEPGAASALDADRVPEGRDVGQTAVFDRRVAHRTLTFEWSEGRFRDRETGSAWDLRGRAVAGPLEGARLEAVAHGNPFWFAWAAFRPDAELWTR